MCDYADPCRHADAYSLKATYRPHQGLVASHYTTACDTHLASAIRSVLSHPRVKEVTVRVCGLTPERSDDGQQKPHPMDRPHL